MKSRRPVPRAAYTLIEVLVALSIIALAIGAASRLSLGQTLTDEIIQKESFAVNYAENAARLWQLGINDPVPLLLRSPNTDGSLMTLTIDSNPATTTVDAPTTLNAGDDGSTADRFAIVVQFTNFRVNWLPPGKTTTTPLDFPVLRQVQPRR
jgi:prepilin-type N-terminal cleavage/methylation domain-containing protein